MTQIYLASSKNDLLIKTISLKKYAQGKHANEWPRNGVRLLRCPYM